VRAGEDVGICSMIMQRNKAGEVMSEDAFRNFFCLVVAAGNDTTRFSLASTIHALANQPSLLDQLREADNKELYQSATDEFIRWASPTTHFRRTATHDFEYGGKRIKEGDKVVLWFLSANRDEDVFESPYEISLTRRPNKSLSFGQGGPHVCLGMFLAKLEVRVVLEELAKRVRIIEQTAQHSYLRSNFILGIKNLPVRMIAI
jgi:cytochrome P450